MAKEFEGYSVTSADWNSVNKDLLAVTYEWAKDDSNIVNEPMTATKDPNLTATLASHGTLGSHIAVNTINPNSTAQQQSQASNIPKPSAAKK